MVSGVMLYTDCAGTACYRWNADMVLPEGNLHPKSLHVVKKVLGIRTPKDVEHHVCVNDCCYFGNLPSGQYQARAAEKCSICKVGYMYYLAVMGWGAA